MPVPMMVSSIVSMMVPTMVSMMKSVWCNLCPNETARMGSGGGSGAVVVVVAHEALARMCVTFARTTCACVCACMQCVRACVQHVPDKDEIV